ncbi:U2B-like nuclear ribonucleoprotein [Fusarium acuminatum]|uniref:U2B-like nuclear ribonucleoprotein n=1 Tax=Fusarium acuminatum TaxID=5515 RepID=A0ABZ2X6N5_9HYPO
MKSKRATEATEVVDKPDVSVDAEAPAKKRKRNEDDGADMKKAKKEKRDKKFKKESRKERKDKRKDLQNLPEQDDEEEQAEDTQMAGTEDKPVEAPVDAEKAAKKEKKKEKKEKAKSEETPKQEDASAEAETKEEPKKSKKDKKKQNKSANDEPVAGAEADADAAGTTAEGKADRHIVFVGNLPFTATAETIKAHFASLNPVGVRCMSDPKDSKPCRGFAFVEFEKVWHMRTCLDKFHHSEFTDGTSAGGGGKTKKRQDKIKEKNQKLNENRTKRIERERIAKDENKGSGDTRQAGADGIHPSRRAHVPGNAR